MKNQNIKNIGFTVASLLTLSGCTTDLTSHPSPIPGNNVATMGVPYFLPALQYDVTAKWTIKSCGWKLIEAPGTSPEWHADIKIDLTVDPAANLIPAESWVVDYQALKNAFKTSSFDIQFYETSGFVKSINAKSEDHSGEIAASFLKSAFSVAKLAIGLPLPGGSTGSKAPPEPKGSPCSKTVVSALGLVESQTSELKRIATAADTATQEVAEYRILAASGTLSEAGKQRLETLIGELRLLEKQKKFATENLKLADNELSISKSFLFPQDPTNTATYNSPLLEPDAATEWFKSKVDPFNIGPLAVTDGIMKIQLNLSAAIPGKTKPENAKAQPGFVYRQPGPGVLTVCAANAVAPSGAGDCAAGFVLVSSKRVVVPQFGWLRVLPLHNGFGEKTNFTADFSKEGVLTSFKFNSEAASAKAAADLVKVAVDEAGGLDKDIRARNKAEASAAAGKTLAALKADNELREEIKKGLALEAEINGKSDTGNKPEDAAKNSEAALKRLREAIDGLPPAAVNP
jgi:hypothetical protein